MPRTTAPPPCRWRLPPAPDGTVAVEGSETRPPCPGPAPGTTFIGRYVVACVRDERRTERAGLEPGRWTRLPGSCRVACFMAPVTPQVRSLPERRRRDDSVEAGGQDTRVRGAVVLLTDDREALIESLETARGQGISALQAIGEQFTVAPQAPFPPSIFEKAPVSDAAWPIWSSTTSSAPRKPRSRSTRGADSSPPRGTRRSRRTCWRGSSGAGAPAASSTSSASALRIRVSTASPDSAATVRSAIRPTASQSVRCSTSSSARRGAGSGSALGSPCSPHSTRCREIESPRRAAKRRNASHCASVHDSARRRRLTRAPAPRHPAAPARSRTSRHSLSAAITARWRRRSSLVLMDRSSRRSGRTASPRDPIQGSGFGACEAELERENTLRFTYRPRVCGKYACIGFVVI